jgi:hypothetical protein
MNIEPYTNKFFLTLLQIKIISWYVSNSLSKLLAILVEILTNNWTKYLINLSIHKFRRGDEKNHGYKNKKGNEEENNKEKEVNLFFFLFVYYYKRSDNNFSKSDSTLNAKSDSLLINWSSNLLPRAS